MSKLWMMVAAIGQGVLFSLALIGAVRISCLMFGWVLPESVAGKLFLMSCMLTGGLSATFYARYLKHAERKALDPNPIGNGDSAPESAS